MGARVTARIRDCSLSPSIVGICDELRSLKVIDSGNITLQAPSKPIGLPSQRLRCHITVLHTEGSALRIVEVVDYLVFILLDNKPRAIPEILCCNTVYRLARAEPLVVVRVVVGNAVLRSRNEPAPLPSKGRAVVVGKRVAYLVVGDGVADIVC